MPCMQAPDMTYAKGTLVCFAPSVIQSASQISSSRSGLDGQSGVDARADLQGASSSPAEPGSTRWVLTQAGSCQTQKAHFACQ